MTGAVNRHGPTVLAGGTHFSLWAPRASFVEVRVTAPRDGLHPLERTTRGYHCGFLAGVEPGARYLYRLDGDRELPDPASRYQPEGVHGPSEVVGQQEPVRWPGRRFRDLVIYEIHTGTFTEEGTFDAIIQRLPWLVELGITALELMPIAQFPGARNWGYDGVYPFAPQHSYGGPAGLRRLVSACHEKGLAVLLDVVYNHFGPEGCNVHAFGPYLSDECRTPWGPAINFDGPGSDEVRAFFIESARHWVAGYGMDGFRLDAVHAIIDRSPTPFLAQLAEAAHEWARELGRPVHLVAESGRNDARLIRGRGAGGFGLDAEWSTDFHHALHVALTGERTGWYADYSGVEDLARAYRDGFVYTGQYSEYRQRSQGSDPRGLPSSAFVVCAQDHDQVGNRAHGERLASLVPFDALKVAAAALLLSQFTPLVFMGEEYGETAPFYFFSSHSEPGLIEAVRQGRRREYGDAFSWRGDPPDPQAESTFERSKLRWHLADGEQGQALRSFYARLLALRRERAVLTDDSAETAATALPESRCLLVRRRSSSGQAALLLAFGSEAQSVRVPLEGRWHRLLDSHDAAWLGSGSAVPHIIEDCSRLTLGPHQAVLFSRGEGAQAG